MNTKRKKAIVTGANAGLGYETTLALAAANIQVVMACRNKGKGEEAKACILQQLPAAQLHVMYIDTGVLSAVESFASGYILQHGRLDLLVNNAGIMMPPYSLSADGFESQLATNYLGHFTLTGLLLPLLLSTPGARVVNVSSLAHRWSGIQFEDINFEKSYNRRKAYGQSKMAGLLHAYELDRRFKANGTDALAVAAHPGLSNTNLAQHLPPLARWLSPVLGQQAAAGAQPIVYAALAPGLTGGEYIGPGGFMEWRGKPAPVRSNKYSYNQKEARRLWQLSEELTGVAYDFTSAV